MTGGAALAGFWARRSGRERVFVLAGLAAVSVLALYLFLWIPGLAARKSLAAALPRMRAQLEDMRWQREEIAALRRKLGAAPRKLELADLLRASVARASFAGTVLRIDTLPSGGVALQLDDVAFDAWLDWVMHLQQELGVRLDSCRISATPHAGRVRVQARFAASSPGRRAP